ncbi:MAG: hypothetical protein ACRY3E_04490 [Candidatus Lariskella arthropodorum]|uniref:hypothetical protein n=1 Tax=Candidatus Lariskella endosymbiont of Epinotia ramella TaxID=3066224 RepID=UPI0030CAD0F3
MFRLSRTTITQDTMPKYQKLFDYLLSQENKSIESEVPPIVSAMLKERDKIKLDGNMLISALDMLINRVNNFWNVEDKAKLIKVIVNTNNDQLVTFATAENPAPEHQKLAKSFSDYVQNRNNATQMHDKLKRSFTR